MSPPPGLPQRVLCLAPAGPIGPGSAGCDAAERHSRLPRTLRPHLRRAAAPRGSPRGRRAGRAEADRSALAAGRARRGQSTARRPHHAAGTGRDAGGRSSAAQLHGDRPEPALGRRHHLHPDLGRLPLPRGGARCLQPPDRGLGDGNAPEDRSGPGRAQHGARATEAGGVIHHSDQGESVHLARLRAPLPGSQWARLPLAARVRTSISSTQRRDSSRQPVHGIGTTSGVHRSASGCGVVACRARVSVAEPVG